MSKEVGLCVSSCEGNVEEMMKKLGDKYGDVCRLVDVIISVIRMLTKVSDEDSHALIKFINIIQKGYNDLKNMNLERELYNATVFKGCRK